MTARNTPWSTHCDEALADGEWHEGLPILRDAEKKITPGVALRKAHKIRAAAAAARTSGETHEPVMRTQSMLIAMGKRSIIQSMVHARRKGLAWEVRPWPLPEGAWYTGGWQVRDLRVTRTTLTDLAEKHRVDKVIARRLIDQEPVLGYSIGRVRYVNAADEEVFLDRLREFRTTSPERRSAASRATQAARRERPKTELSLTELGQLYHVSGETCRMLQEQHPELGWRFSGRWCRLPIDRLPEWEAAVETYRGQAFQRRSEASRRGRATRREVDAAPSTPTFTDPTLTEEFTRYQAGDTSLRESVYNGMREAFQRADAEAGGGHAMFWDQDGQPMTLWEWTAAFEDVESRILARTEVGPMTVMTVWLGTADFEEVPPLIFGSIIKIDRRYTQEIRSATREEALAAHNVLVTECEQLITAARDE